MCCACCSLDHLKQECSQRKVFVLPAFETAPLENIREAHALASSAAAQSKEGLMKMVEKEQLWQFALKIFKQVHRVWCTAPGCSSQQKGCASDTSPACVVLQHSGVHARPLPNAAMLCVRMY